MPTNYQTLITEVKKTRQDNIKMAPMFKGTPGKEPDRMSLLELLGAAYAILKEQDVSGAGNDAMKQWLSGVWGVLDTIDSLPPEFPQESVFSAALAAGGDEAMKKLMGDKASLQALGELEERDRNIMSLFAVKVMGATLDLPEKKQSKEQERKRAEQEAKLREEQEKKERKEQEKRFDEQSAHAEDAARAAYERNERAEMERQAAALLREENLSASPDNMERRAALLRKENPSARPDKQKIIQESVLGDPGQRRYYDDALKAALQRAGLTEQELKNNADGRIQRSRSAEFSGFIQCAAMARDSICDNNGARLGGHMKGMAEYCIRYLNKYPKVRSTQSGRDSYELALNLLATCADPNDPEVKACIDGVNAKRGAKPGTKNFIDLGDYGPDRLLGRKVPAGEYMKDVDKRIAEQLKRSKDKSLTPDDMLKAKYEANRLKVEKLYLKTAVTPSKAVYPDRIAEKTKELWSDKRLMDKLVANQSEKEQARIMREHLASETASAQPKTAQNEKQQDAPVAGK